MNLLEWALTYARQGWPVFPCDPRTKRPLPPKDKDADGKPVEGSGGLKKATTDEAQIRAWWARWPRAMIGFCPGDRAGVFMFDVDAGPDKSGAVVTLEELLAQLGALGIELPATWTVKTPRGGRHYYFKQPRPGFGNGKGALPVRFDVRGEAGYVILPPSQRADGAAYEWLTKPKPAGETAPAEAPAALLDCIAREGAFAPARPAPARPVAAPARPANVPAAALSAEDEAVRRYCEGALEAALAELASTPAGNRNNEINRVAFKLGELVAAGGLTESQARDGLDQVVAQWPSVAKSRGAVERGLKAGMAKPTRDLENVRAQARARITSFDPSFGASPPDLPAPPPADFSDYGSESATLPSGRQTEQPSRPGGQQAATGANGAAGAERPQRRVKARRQVGSTSRRARDQDEEAYQRSLDATCAHFPLTDLGNAERFAIRQRGRFIWCVGLKCWFAWDGKRWAREASAEKVLMAEHETVRAIQHEADWYEQSEFEHVAEIKYKGTKHEEEVPYSALLRHWGRASEEARRMSPIQKRGVGMLSKLERELDANKWAINFNNGTLLIDPKNKAEPFTFKVHDPEDYITKLAPVDYDEEARCPIYDEFLEFVQPSPPLRRFIHQWGGLSLTGDISEQRFAFWWGKGRNGKTTALEAWQGITGDYGKAAPVETFLNDGRARSAGGPSPDLAMLRGVRFVHTNEPEKGTKLSEGLVKLITGGDETPVRDLYGGFFDLRPQFTLTMCGNHKPNISGGEKSSGIWRRMTLVPWTVTIPEEKIDKELPDKLRVEAAGILNRLLAGLADWIEHGLQLPEEVIAATESYRSDSDPLGRFLEACTEAAEGGRVQSSQLHQVFIAWCKANGEREWTPTGFGRALRERGYESKHSDVNWWLGIALTKSVKDFSTGSLAAGDGGPASIDDYGAGAAGGKGADDDFVAL
ncbi:MAG: phage/plasmid primase, P4 family [Pseudolabrys sp.]